jgi:glycosyltransferase involved in cell wall biosynthesis
VAEGNSSPEPIKVLRLIARLNVGGPALHVAYLSAGLADRGYDTMLVAGMVGSGEESMAFVAEKRGVRIETLNDLHREIAPLRDLRTILRLSRLIRRERPTILHTHTAKAGAVGRIAALLAGDARPPVIVHTFHGHVLQGYFNPVLTAAFRVLEQMLARVTTALVAVSPEVRDDLVALGVAPASKFVVVRLGIELDERVSGGEEERRATRRLLGIPPDAFVVGWIGRMTAVKRTEDIARTLQALVRRGVDAYLCLVGDGPDRARLERRMHELGVAKRCLSVGYQENVARFYDAMDALLLTSVNEGTPVSVIEALAAGRPVVATRVGGVSDVVRNGVDGFLVEVGDVESLAARLAELAGDPELRARMGNAGRAHVIERYAVERLVDDVDRLYRSLLPPRGAAVSAPDGISRAAG